MTKEELIALVKERLAGGDAPATIAGIYHPEVISRYLEMAYDDMIFQSYLLGEKTGDFSQVDNYIQRYYYSPKKDPVSDQNYIQLDVQPVSLPDNFAIRQVSAQKDQLNIVFAPIDPVAAAVFNKLEVNFVDPTPGYSFEGSRLYFDDRYPVGLQNLMVKMIVGFSSLKNTDQVFIVGGNNAYVFEKVCQLMIKQPKVNQDDMTTKQV